MNRIGKAYSSRFRSLLLRLHARQLEQGVALLINKAQQQATRSRQSLPRALSEKSEHLRGQVKRWHQRHSGETQASGPRRFLCDAGLGGLARWLRAAGCEAIWEPDLDDAGLIERARSLGATLLTTDSLMMERGDLRDGRIPSFWIPPVLKKREQLALVIREFDLVAREPRCMRCGGELRRVDKESMRDRIPPRTWRWLNEYFACSACGGLFWKGTHWLKIQETLRIADGTR